MGKRRIILILSHFHLPCWWRLHCISFYLWLRNIAVLRPMLMLCLKSGEDQWINDTVLYDGLYGCVCVCVRVRLGSCLGGFISACAGLCMCVSFLRSKHINVCILYVRRLWGIEQREEKSIKKTACSLSAIPNMIIWCQVILLAFTRGEELAKKQQKNRKSTNFLSILKCERCDTQSHQHIPTDEPPKKRPMKITRKR